MEVKKKFCRFARFEPAPLLTGRTAEFFFDLQQSKNHAALLIISLSNLIVERNFVIWMLEPDLKVLKIQETKENSIGTQKELSLMKVMYNENTELLVDQELNVPEKVIQAGMGYLIENSVMIPKSQRKDSNFHISYINLNSVTSSETLLNKYANLHL